MLQGESYGIRETTRYEGRSHLLVLFGIGAAVHAAARAMQIGNGGRTLMWDLGYVGRAKVHGCMRASIDRDHPQHLLDRAPPDGTRWDAFGLPLREDSDAGGPIVLVGMGQKQRAYKGHGWEAQKFAELQRRFPGRRIVYRPKRDSDEVRLACERDGTSAIETILKGASLLVCRHSNTAVDAVIAGVPFEAEDGAAVWLLGKPYTQASRLEFLRRLAWFQWKPNEMREAWRFLKTLT